MEVRTEKIYVNVGELLNKMKRSEKLAEARENPNNLPLTSWKTTAGEIALINAGSCSALASFFFQADNYRHIKMSAYRFMRNNAHLKSVVSYEDLIQQFFVDLRTGVLMLKPYDKGIANALYTSFRYAAVGGLSEDEIYLPK